MRAVLQRLASRAILRAGPARRPLDRALASSSSSDDPARAMRPMPEGAAPVVDEDMPKQDEEELRRRRAQALKSWLEDELGTEKTALMAVLAKHRVQIPGGGDEAKALLEELLEWKAEGVVNARSMDAAD